MIRPMLAETLDFPFSSGHWSKKNWKPAPFPKDFHGWDFAETWWMSEKFDGVRAFWDGKTLRTRTGNSISAPNWLIEQLPKHLGLDGELFGGPGRFPHTNGTVQRKRIIDEEWQNIVYMVFDVCDPKWLHVPFEKRYAQLRQVLPKNQANVFVVPHSPVKSTRKLYDFYQTILARGGEGVMLRNPQSVYEQRRSKQLLKFKPVLDAEAVVRGYTEGKGANRGRLGSFHVEMLDRETRQPNGRLFQLSGRINGDFRQAYQFDNQGKLSRAPAKHSGFPVVGSVVTYEYMTMTHLGYPRQPIYMRLLK